MRLLPPLRRRRCAGFTLVEAYISTLLLVAAVLALTACQLFAMKIYQLAATKLTATASARKAINYIRDQVRESSWVDVGIYNATNNTFSTIGAGNAQIGNAAAIYPSNPNNAGSPTVATVYFMNQAASNLCSVTMSNGTVLTSTLSTNIIVYITNYYVFDAEDYYTNIVTTSVNDRVIHVIVQFAQWEYPIAGVSGQNAIYDYYQLQTRATRRIMDY
jgi:Tfp pilus assembly protein PilV